MKTQTEKTIRDDADDMASKGDAMPRKEKRKGGRHSRRGRKGGRK